MAKVLLFIGGAKRGQLYNKNKHCIIQIHPGRDETIIDKIKLTSNLKGERVLLLLLIDRISFLFPDE